MLTGFESTNHTAELLHDKTIRFCTRHKNIHPLSSKEYILTKQYRTSRSPISMNGHRHLLLS